MITRLMRPGLKASAYIDKLRGLLDIGHVTQSGQTVNEEKALTLSAVWCAVNLISNAIKSLPVFVYKRLSENEREVVRDHPVSRILRVEPNPDITPSRFKRYIQACVLLWGNGYAEIERDGLGRPLRLWPIHPSRVEPESKNGVLVYKVHNETGVTIPLARDKVFHVMGLSTDGISGKSAITTARESIGMALAQRGYGAAFFKNSANPSIVIKTLGELSEPGQQNLRTSWQQIYGGENRGGVAVLEEGFDITPFGMPNDDAQFIESMTFSITEIARWYQMPPHKLAELTRATFSNIEHLAIEYVGDGIVPHTTDWQDEINRKLFLESERDNLFCEFNLKGLMRSDSAARSEYYQKRFNIGTITANEIRALESENPVGPEGDRLYVPVNMMPADQAAQGNTGNRRSGDDRRQAVDVDALLESQTGVLIDVLTRMWRRQASAFERVQPKGESAIEQWAADYYPDFEPHVRVALIPAMEALSSILRSICFPDVLSAEWAAAVGAYTKQCVCQFVASCRKPEAIDIGAIASDIIEEARAFLETYLDEHRK